VALTRARYSMVVLGHRQTLLSSPLWGALVTDAEKRQLIRQLTPNEIDLREDRVDNLFQDFEHGK
jgi:superfamily I DNA and/or RNA helicase